MKNILIIITIFLIGTLVYGQNLKFNIELEKETYLIQEQITLLIKIDNLTSATQMYNLNLFSKIFKVSIIDEFGNKFTNKILFGNVKLKNTLLAAGQSHYLYYELLPFSCTNNEQEQNYIYSLGNIKPGYYTIICEYNFKGKIGTISSNQLDFKVEFPKTTVHKNQYNKYVELVRNSKSLDYAQYDSKVNDIISLDPTSPYSILATKRQINKSNSLGNSSNSKKLMEKICLEHPNSFVSLAFILDHDDIRDKILKTEKIKTTKIKDYGDKIHSSKQKLKKVK